MGPPSSRPRAVSAALAMVAPPVAVAGLWAAWSGVAYVRDNRYLELGRRHLAASYVSAEVLRSAGLALAFALPLALLVLVLARRARNLAPFAVVAIALQALWLVPVLEASQSWRILRVRYGFAFPNLPWRVDTMLAEGRPSLVEIVVTLGVVLVLTVAVTWGVARRTREHEGGWPGLAWRRFGAVCAVVAVLTCGAAWAWPRFVQPPSETGTGAPVVFVTWDSVRADHLSAYGYGRDTTPRLAELGRDGLVFEHAYSNYNWTRPSYMSMLTSKMLWELDLERMNEGSRGAYVGRMLESNELLAEVLRDAGYATRGFVQSPHLTFVLGMDQGCERYMQFDLEARPGEIAERVGEAIDQLSGQPFFLFVHLLQPHYPYVVEGPFLDPEIDPSDPPLREQRIFNLMSKQRAAGWDADSPTASDDLQYMLDLYDRDILETDAALGAIVDRLKSAGIYDETLIVLNSDHGDEFFDHESFGHAHLNLHQEVVRVPLVVKPPAHLGFSVARSKILAQNMDVYPTVLDAVGLPRPEELRGASLFDLVRQPDPERLVLSTIGKMVAVRSRDHLYVRDFAEQGDPRVFDVSAAPDELTPLDDPNAAPLYATMRAVADWWASECLPGAPRSAPAEEEDLPADVVEQLRALGYVGD